jgi:23S rRNA pseudouridine2605 synthase
MCRTWPAGASISTWSRRFARKAQGRTALGFLRYNLFTMLRLNKFLAHAGVGSRRHCDDLIAAGRVKINGEIIRDLGTRIDPEKVTVHVDDHHVRTEKHVYWAVNKPRGYLCTNHDPAGRPLATDLIPHVDQRVYTVGRLDEDSEGLLLMTNDGDLAQQLMHPRFGVEKTYEVLVAGSPTPADLRQLTTGVYLAEGRVKAKFVKRFKRQGESTWLKIVLAEGKNREIRRMLAKLNHKVMRLRRVAIGPVRLDRLPKGKSRKLALPEIEGLRKIGGRRAQPVGDVS